MAILTISNTADFLQNHDHYAIVTHRRPDGDTLGSAAVLCRGLRQLGKTAHVLHNPEVTPKYAFLLEGLTKSAPEEGDTLICVDVASPGMLPAAFMPLQDKLVLRIDHHRNDTPFTENELVDPKCAACGQLIWRVLAQMGAFLDKDIATALYTAISTDTGCFRFANTQPETFRLAGSCAEYCDDLFKLNHTLFETNSLARLKIQGWMAQNARFLRGGTFCICPIPLDVEKDLGVTEDDMENISGFPRTIEGVELAVTLRQENEHKVKLSVRCTPQWDASFICGKLGGGGHRGAAGASVEMTMAEAVETVIGIIEQL
jgi:phosphoesterase RecJ-like protein